MTTNRPSPCVLDYLSEEELSQVRTSSFSLLAIQAREAGFQYCRLKTRGGTAMRFSHDAGYDRYYDALNAVSVIGQISDSFSNRTPAVSVQENTAIDVLRHRRSGKWLRENIENCAAKTIYALSLQFKGVSNERQKKLLSEENIDAAIEKIKQKPYFRRMVRKEGLNGLADRLVNGAEALTEAVMKATNAPNHPPKTQEEKTSLEKAEFWKEAPTV